MRDAIKIMLIPIVGIIGIGLIFLFVVWAGSFQSKIENPAGMHGLASADLGNYDVVVPTMQCDETAYYPVCGENGKTYDNVCMAKRAGTTVAHRGVCQG